MGKQIEVEVRGRISDGKLNKVLEKFKEEARFIEEKDRITFIYFKNGIGINDLSKVREDPVDLRVRITNKKAEIVMKYGRWGAVENRKEFLFPIEIEKFGQAVEFLKCLNWEKGVLVDTKTFVFDYKGIEFAIVRSGDFCYFEAEKLVDNKSEAPEVIEEIKKVCEEMGLKIFEEEEYICMIQDMNERKDRLFDMSQDDFEEIRKKFSDFF